MSDDAERGVLVVCEECEYEEVMPFREHAEHAKKVHEDRYDHRVVLED